MAEINEKYVKSLYPDMQSEYLQKVINVMKKYGDNHWWESKDPLQIAMYQIFEDTFLASDFSLFHEGLEKLVGRPVYTHEMGLNVEGLREEAKLAIQRLKSGIGISEEQRTEAVIRSISMLEEYCKKTGKPLLKIDLSEKSDRDKNGNDISGYDGWLNPEE